MTEPNRATHSSKLGPQAVRPEGDATTGAWANRLVPLDTGLPEEEFGPFGDQAPATPQDTRVPRTPEDSEDECPEEQEQPEHEEGARPRMKAQPVKPSDEEVRRHMATHVPYRSWCQHCIAGKSGDDPHRRGHKPEGAIPVVSIDYAWMTDKGQEAGMPFLVLTDRKSQYVAAHVVPRKGEDPYAIGRLKETLVYLGYPELVLKSDDESAIKSLKAAVQR